MLDDVEDCSNQTNTSSKDQNQSHLTLDIGGFPPRYRDVCLIGCGSKSFIFSAIDQTSLRRLAIKKISVNQEEKVKALQQIFREIRILHRLEHQNITKIYHVLISTATSPNDKQDPGLPPVNDVPGIDCLYIGMELMDTDLRNVLSRTTLSPEYIGLFMYQILRGLKFIHSGNVMHRDLTPSNVFINEDTLMLKIGDFGVSRMFDCEYDHAYHLSMPLTTKYYQAPELLLHPRHYTKEIDVWSTGCIFIEMLKGLPAFPGDHAVEMMSLILNSVPVTKESWESVVAAGCENIDCCAPTVAYTEQGNRGLPQLPLEKLVTKASSSALNLLKQLLYFDPAGRIDAEDALAHPHFCSYANPRDEPLCHRPFHIEDEINECSCSDLEVMLQSETFSVASSFSRSTDTTLSMTSTRNILNDVNMLRVDSSAGIVANGSYRHLLSLAENNQSDVLSESEVRTIACDLDYGVQIHECSFNKDRMSMDFRPISSNEGCFDPYKWDHNARDTMTQSCKEEPNSFPNTLRPNKSFDTIPKGVLRSDTGYHSSYCSSSVTNRISNVTSLSHWSLSSLDISSDHEQRIGCSTPDSISSPPSHSTNDASSLGYSPTIQEDSHPEAVALRRHNDCISHQSSSRRHHHHHHRHHHHSHHGKHKNRQQTHSTSGTVNYQKPGSGDGSGEHVENNFQSNGEGEHKRECSKRSKSFKDKEPLDQDIGKKDTPDTFMVLPKHIIVTAPDNVVILRDGGTTRSQREKLNLTLSLESSIVGKTRTFIEKKESIHEHSLVSMKETYKSAFSKYSCCQREKNIAIKCEETPSEGKVEDLDLNSGSPDPVEIRTDSLSRASIENMWKADLGVKPAVSEYEPQRSRAWSGGCHMRSPRLRELARFPRTVKHEQTKCTGVLTCGIVHKIRTQLGQLFSEGCCLPPSDLSAQVLSSGGESKPLTRMRHFSDDWRFVCLHRSLTNTWEGFASDVSSTTRLSPTSCAGAEEQARAVNIHRTRLECPF